MRTLKYKLLKFGKSYVSRDGRYMVTPLSGNKKQGYTFLMYIDKSPFGLSTNTTYFTSRIVESGEWLEIPKPVIRRLSNLAEA